MDFRQLANFVQIVDLGSMTRAAGKIGVAQPALTFQIARLEMELDCRLLIRSRQGVRATEAGMVLYKEACSITRQLQQIPKTLRNSTTDPSGEVTIGYPNSLAAFFSTAVVAIVQQRYPRVKLNIVEAESVLQRENIMKNRVEVALICEHAPTPELHHRPLFKQRIALLCDSRSAKESGKPIDLADAASCIGGLPNTGNPVRIAFDEATRRLGLTVEARLEFNAMSTLTDAVARGYGASINLWMPQEAKGSKDIVFRPIVNPDIWIEVSLCRSRTNQVSPIALLIEGIMEEVAMKRIGRADWHGAISNQVLDKSAL
jgi:LysR family nitrogen assimilation transcriptional regulator